MAIQSREPDFGQVGGRVKRGFSAAMGCSARLSAYFCSGAKARVAARGLLGGRRREQARCRASASAEGGGYQAMRWSNSKAGAGWSSGSAAVIRQ
jgi:hypothetical protein